MFKYVLKRVLIGFVTLFVLGSATFFLMKATPGSPVNGERFKSKEAQELAIIRYGLDRPVFEQYTMYLNNLAHGDLGESYVKEGVYVDKTIADTFPVTARLGGVAFLFALVVGITLGTTAALSKRKWVNNVCMFVATIGVSVPSFLLSMFLIIIFGVELRLLPFVGLRTPANYVLPIIALSLYPVVTYAGPAFAFMLTGSFVVETIFSIPGTGKEFVSNISNRDYQMIMGLTLFLGALIITFNIITDIVAAMIDPRIKLK